MSYQFIVSTLRLKAECSQLKATAGEKGTNQPVNYKSINSMKFTVSIILTALLSFVACLYLPWWSIAIVSFLIAIIILQKPYMSFIAGFVALLLLWGGLAWWISMANHDLIAHKISVLVINADSPFLLIGLTALIGAMVAAFSALSGALLRRLF